MRQSAQFKKNNLNWTNRNSSSARQLLNLKWVENHISWFVSVGEMDRIHIPYNKEQGIREDLEWIFSSFINIRANHKSRRKILDAYKANRTLFWKIVGLDRDEKRKFLQELPKGTSLWVPQLAKIFPLMSVSQKRYWSTVLFCTRLITLPAEPNYSVITDGSVPEGIVNTISKEVGKFWYKCGITRTIATPRHLSLRKWHFSAQKGPNGRVISSLVWDAKSLTEEQIAILSEQSGPKMTNTINFLRQLSEEVSSTIHPRPSRGIESRRIAVFPDMEGKTRIIGELDYFNQASLKPLHHHIFRILKSIPQDYTFNQDGARPVISSWKEIYSCDLTAATDRFPIDLIVKVLGFLPQAYTANWKKIMVDLPFRCPDGNLRNYAVGNPMGAYSSWSSFALAHHYIVMYACELVGQDWRKAPYILLGDDIAFGNKELYMKYREVISSLGVQVSIAKTHESKTFGEFAKRLYFKGDEITPFPLRGLRECHVKVFDLANLFFQEQRRGYFSAGGTPTYVQSYQKYISRVSGRLDLPSKYDSSKLLATASTVCYQYQKKHEFSASVEVGKVVNLLHKEDKPIFFSNFSSRLLMFSAYWFLIEETANKRARMSDESNLLTLIKRVLRDPISEGPWDPDKLSPWWELVEEFDVIFKYRKQLSFVLQDMPSDPKQNSVPRLFIKHLGAPSLEANFSLSERKRELLVSGRVAKKLISMLKDLLENIRTGRNVDGLTIPIAEPDLTMGTDVVVTLNDLAGLVRRTKAGIEEERLPYSKFVNRSATSWDYMPLKELFDITTYSPFR